MHAHPVGDPPSGGVTQPTRAQLFARPLAPDGWIVGCLPSNIGKTHNSPGQPSGCLPRNRCAKVPNSPINRPETPSARNFLPLQKLVRAPHPNPFPDLTLRPRDRPASRSRPGTPLGHRPGRATCHRGQTRLLRPEPDLRKCGKSADPAAGDGGRPGRRGDSCRSLEILPGFVRSGQMPRL